jgi:hypothetical protein
MPCRRSRSPTRWRPARATPRASRPARSEPAARTRVKPGCAAADLLLNSDPADPDRPCRATSPKRPSCC